MDPLTSYLASEILKALGEGALIKASAFVAIFLLVWIEVRGVKNEVKSLNKTIAKSFADGEIRFTKLELAQVKTDQRLSLLEKKGT